ncbi:MAG TPA: 3',5'-cyclic-nucleotide phosphodiesterase [Methylomirabilota bacterium]|jgi:cAMP phosphodiesterase|nr:3',5'-cyclic-nucleotide phosphodiesterase [Methylomirabilota bacterium]
MKIRVLGAFGAEGLAQRPAAFLINDRVLLDGGTVGGALTPPEQLAIEHAVITHSHLDHVAGLAFLTETLALCEAETPLTITAVEPVIDALRTAVFNNVVWPDFSQIPRADHPVVKYRTLVEDAEQRVGDLWVTPVMVNHTVPTSGFIIHDGSTGFIYSADTGPTEALWQAARGLRGLRAVILECAYPNRLRELAEIARHMTPARIQRELPKLPPDVPVWIYHVKPQFAEEIGEELVRIGGGRVTMVEQDKTYSI